MPDTNRATQAGGELGSALRELPGSLANLGGLLSGQGKPNSDGTGSLVSVDKALTTRSVVESIFLIIAADAGFSILFSVLGI